MKDKDFIALVSALVDETIPTSTDWPSESFSHTVKSLNIRLDGRKISVKANVTIYREVDTCNPQ
jgi:hypothetical protein